MGPCRLLKTTFAQFLGKYRVVSALFGKIERLTFTGTFDAFQHLVKSHSFKQICFPHRSEMGVLKSFLDSGLSLVDVDPSLNILFGSFKQVFGCGQAVDLL